MILSRRRALRDFQEFRNLVEQTWRSAATEQDTGKVLDQFTQEVLGAGSKRHSANAVLTTLFRLHQIRVDALSDGRRRGQESRQTIALNALADTIAQAVSPRMQVFDQTFEPNVVARLIIYWFPVSISAARKVDFSRDNHRPFAALLLGLTADFKEWDTLSGVYNISGFRKELRKVERLPPGSDYDPSTFLRRHHQLWNQKWMSALQR